MRYLLIKKSTSDKLLIIAKISVLVFVGIYLFGNFEPYFHSSDAYTYAMSTKFLSEGKLAITNELLEETSAGQFAGGTAWIKTIHDSAIPQSFGISYFAVVFYLVFGEYGLFYFNPVITILFLVSSERIATKLFNQKVGLFTLLFLSTNHLIFRTGVSFQTENLAALFFILGSFFLIKFLKSRKDTWILLSSSFFSLSVFIRLSGILVFPLELFLIPIYFVYLKKSSNWKSESSIKSMFFELKNPKNFKKMFYFLIPWILFLIFWFSFNDFYFGDPLTNYRMENQGFDSRLHRDSNLSSFYKLEWKHFDIFKEVSKYLLPYQIPSAFNSAENPLENTLGKSWIFIFYLGIMALAILISFKKNKQKMEILAIVLLTLPTIWFYASVTTEERAELGVPARYIIPALPLSYILLSYIIVKILSLEKESLKIIKWIFGSIMFIFFVGAFYFSPPIQDIKNDEFNFKNPIIYGERYPLDLEGLESNSVVAARHTDWVLDYRLIPFTLPMKEKLTDEDVFILKNTINNGYNVFTFKAPTYPLERDVLVTLIENHGFILKDFSNTFCKLELQNNNNKSDKICLTTEHEPHMTPITIQNYGY